MNDEEKFLEFVAAQCDERNPDETCSRYEGTEHEPTDCLLKNCPKREEIRSAGIALPDDDIL